MAWALAWVMLVGCRAHPGQLAISLVEQYVDARDVQERGRRLIGHSAEEADEMFGRRLDTLCDGQADRLLIVYREPGRADSDARFFVEIAPDGCIENLCKGRFNLAGVTDLQETKEVRGKALGKPRCAAEAAANLGPALRVLESAENGQRLCLYVHKGVVPTMYTDYCILWFHPRTGVCVETAMLGVVAGYVSDRLHHDGRGSEDGSLNRP